MSPEFARVTNSEIAARDCCGTRSARRSARRPGRHPHGEHPAMGVCLSWSDEDRRDYGAAADNASRKFDSPARGARRLQIDFDR